MANLDGSRSHGGRWDVLAGAILRDDPSRFTRTYRVLFEAARLEGIGSDRVADCRPGAVKTVGAGLVSRR
jgi:putative restriction endonuclease